MKNKITEILKITQKKNFKLVVIFSVFLSLFLVLIYWLLFGEKQEIQIPNQEINKPIEVVPTTSQLTINESIINEETKEDLKPNEEQNPIIKNDNKSAIDSSDEKTNKNQSNQIIEIDTNVKNKIIPKDMRNYLKSIQGEILIHQKNFMYKNRNYQIGDNFEGFMVENINYPLYIRFFDRNTGLHYNLRFLSGEKQ